MSGGNVLAGFQVYSFASGMINAGIGAISGDWSGVGAGIGGMIGSVVGWNAGVSGAALLSDAVPRFVVGAVEGAIEFGASGFGAGFGYGIGGGSSFRDAAKIGLITGGVSAVAGAIIEGTYMAGWQSILHGATTEDIARARGTARIRVGFRPPHTGIEIEGTGQYDGRWGFNPDFESEEFSLLKVLQGKDVPGKIYTDKTGEKPYWLRFTVSRSKEDARMLYNAIQVDMKKTGRTYNLYRGDCYGWRDQMFRNSGLSIGSWVSDYFD